MCISRRNRFQPQGPYKNGPGEINVPIACGGQVVFPGDILVGDEDGIVVIHQEFAEALAEEAVVKHRKEVEELEKRAAAPDKEEMETRHKARWVKLLAQSGAQIIDFTE